MIDAVTPRKEDTTPFYKTAEYNKQVGDWLLTREWSHWATLTTPYELTLNGARRLADRFHKKINKEAPTEMFWACEPFDVKEGQHIHALLKVPPGMPYKAIIDTYQKVTGAQGWSRIQLDEFRSDWKKEGAEQHEEGKGATFYVSKYITKRLSDYDLLTPIKAKRKRARGSR